MHLLNHSRVSGTSTEGQALLCVGTTMVATRDRRPCPHGGHILVYHTLGGEKSSEGTKQRWGSGSGGVRMENWSLDEVVPGGESGIRRKHWRE